MNAIGCPAQTYKSRAGNDNCTACPDNSHADSEASVSCRCAAGLVSHVVDGELVRCLGKLNSAIVKARIYNVIICFNIFILEVRIRWEFPWAEVLGMGMGVGMSQREWEGTVSAGVSPVIIYRYN